MYDASYVAVAESLGAELITLDARLAGATRPRCAVLTPPGAGAGGMPLEADVASLSVHATAMPYVGRG